MRWILRQLLFHFASLITASYIIPGFTLSYAPYDLAYATAALAVLNVFVKPVVKILFLPINLITLNLFTLVINGAVVYGLTRIVPSVSLNSWQFPGYSGSGIIIPALPVSVLYTYIIVAIVITITVSVLNWVTG